MAVKEMRLRFRQAMRGQNTVEYLHGVCPEDLQQLSAEQLLNLMRAMRAPENANQILANAARAKLAYAMIAHPGFNTWYRATMVRARAMAITKSDFITSGHVSQLSERRTMARRDIYAAIPDLFMVHTLMERVIANQCPADLRSVLSVWRENRYDYAFFPRYQSGQVAFNLIANDRTPYLERFMDRVVKAYRRLPDYARTLLAGAGYTINVAYHLGDIQESYRKDKPPFDDAHTYEEVAMGVHTLQNATIDIPYHTRKRHAGDAASRSGPVMLSQAAHNEETAPVEESLGHEVAHGIEMQTGYLSARREFMNAYNQDIQEMKSIMRDGVRYYLPKNHGGMHPSIGDARAEAFAEILMEHMFGRIDGLSVRMPAASSYIGRIDALLRQDLQHQPDILCLPSPDDMAAIGYKPTYSVTRATFAQHI